MSHPTPRPDQLHGGRPGASGSRSGAAELAGSLGYPGTPPAVPNCTAAVALRRGVAGGGGFFAFPQAARIWTVMLSYTITSDTTYTPSAPVFAAFIELAAAPLPLAVVELSLADVKQHDSGVCPVSYNGLPVTAGDSITLTINGGVSVTGVRQEASAVVLYSIP
jgi:hypothetical protein